MWELAHDVIDQYIKGVNSPDLTKAWILAKKIIAAQASLYVPQVSEEIAMSMAWEDFEMACRGVGQPGIGGAIFHLWSRTSRQADKTFQRVLTTAFAAAADATQPSAFCYAAHYRSTPIATLEKGFGKREVKPISAYGVTPGEAPEGYLIGETPLPEKKATPPSNFKFTVLKGGRE